MEWFINHNFFFYLFPTNQIQETKFKRQSEDLATGADGVCQAALNNVLEGKLILSHPSKLAEMANT